MNNEIGYVSPEYMGSKSIFFLSFFLHEDSALWFEGLCCVFSYDFYVAPDTNV